VAERRTLLIVTATVLALGLVALLGWRSYVSIRQDEALRIGRRQQVLAGTIAIAIGSELGSRRTQLLQMNRLPSVQYLTEPTLASRLNDMFAADVGVVTEIVRVTADGRLRVWRPFRTSFIDDSPARTVIDEQLSTWARQTPHGDRTTMLPLRDGSATDLVLAAPTHETAIGNEDYSTPSGAYAGMLLVRLDVAHLVSRYMTHALDRSPESSAALLVGPGAPAFVATGIRASRDAIDVTPALWALLLAGTEATLEQADGHGHDRIASWSRVPDVPLPLYVWLDQDSTVADQAVWPLLLRQAPLFLLLATGVLALGWALQRSHRSEARYRALFTHAADGIVVLSPEGSILDINPAGSRAIGLGRTEAVGRAFASLLSADQMKVWHQYLGEARAGQPRSGDFTLTRRDGEEVAASISVAPVSAGRLLAVVRDVSDRRALEAELRHAHKMEAVGRLAGGVAHDFNNLLTAILGYNELLLHQLQPGDPRREDAVELGRAATRAADLTQRLLAFGRRQMLEPRVFALNDLIRGLERLLRRLIGAPVTIEFDLAPNLWRVDADPGQMEQVLINLAMNARDAMPDGGVLRISTGNETLSDAQAQKLDLRAGDYVTLVVTDTGIGIGEDVRPHLFEPFFTTKPLGTGTGLGLPTVYGIVQQSGGAVEVESEPGRGTTLRIFLPRTHQPLPEVGPSTVEAVVPRGRATILLVEDEPAVRRLLATGLRGHGYTVLEASQPLEALALFEAQDHAIGVLMSDVMMPHMTGTALAHKLRAQRPDLPVVLMSGYAMDVFDRDPPPEGALLLQKPFTADAAARAIAPLLTR
jgi:PAS domain S-box-containing protein